MGDLLLMAEHLWRGYHYHYHYLNFLYRYCFCILHMFLSVYRNSPYMSIFMLLKPLKGLNIIIKRSLLYFIVLVLYLSLNVERASEATQQ